MIAEEQKKLADYIKSVHLSLRCKSRKIGAELAWKQHIENEDVLQNYSVCMKSLAENYWSVNNRKESDKCLCRIKWMLNVVNDYFDKNGIETELIKEKRKLETFVLKLVIDKIELEKLANVIYSIKEPYRLLDVGSCYDPFAVYDKFQTFAVDLCPAVESVKKCDFTQLVVEDIENADWFHDNFAVLPRNYFDIVIFSLFLEYLPSPEQRYRCCEKAYETLKVNGLLLIATPDSKHETANSKIMKSWKLALAQIGFVRIKLEKLRYLYCMAFRKAVSSKYPMALYNIKEDGERSIPIPQDYVDYEMEENIPGTSGLNEENDVAVFEELPCSDVDIL